MKKRNLAKLSLANLFFFALSSLVASPASADLLVDFQSGMIMPGGRQQIDVFVSSTSTDGFFLYEILFGIDPVSATAGTSVTFVDPMDEDFISDSTSNYVFAGNSTQANNSPSDVFVVTNSPAPPAVSAFDETASGFDVTVGTTPVLLSRLVVQHNLGSASPEDVVGDAFTISLFSEFQFGDEAFLNDTSAAIPFSMLTAGVLTVTAIPEPGTFAFTGLAALGMLQTRRRRS